MIPRRIFQGWIGSNPMPEREKQWCEQMKKLNPGWEYVVFGNEIFDRYGEDPYVKALLNLGKPMAFVADRLRMLLLRDHGGIWLDPDAQPVRPLDTLRDVWDSPATFVAGFRSPYRPQVALHRGVSLIDNTFLASAPNSRMCRRILGLWRAPHNIVIDGHAVGVEIMDNCHSDVVLLNHRYFYGMQATPETVVLHDAHNLSSWVEQTKAEQRMRVAAV